MSVVVLECLFRYLKRIISAITQLDIRIILVYNLVVVLRGLVMCETVTHVITESRDAKVEI